MLLAKNSTTTWSLVFDREEASLAVERRGDDVPGGYDRQTVDDFLSTVPVDAVHAEAVERLIKLLTAVCKPDTAAWKGDIQTAMAWAAFSAYCLALEDDFRGYVEKFLSAIGEDPAG